VDQFPKYSQLTVSPELGYFYEIKGDEGAIPPNLDPYRLLRADGLFTQASFAKMLVP